MSAARLLSESDVSQMTVDEVRRRAAPLLQANPRLTVDGWPVGRAPYVGRDFDYEQVRVAVLFLLTFGRRRRTFNGNADSYTLKHAAENWVRASGTFLNVSNGEMILAALVCGYKLSERHGSRNSTFNLVLSPAIRHYACYRLPFGRPFRPFR